MPRRTSVLAVALAALAAPRLARADLSGATLPDMSSAALRIKDSSGNYNIPGTSQDTLNYFNRAHCICSLDALGDQQSFALFIQDKSQPSATTPHQPGQLWSGPMCDTSPTQRDTACEKLAASIPFFDTSLYPSGTQVEINMRAFMSPHPVMATSPVSCPDLEGTGNAMILVDDGTGTLFSGGVFSQAFDSHPPTPPTSLSALPAENGITIQFDPQSASNPDLQAFQALCARADTGAPGESDPANRPSAGARYKTANALCGANDANDVPITMAHTQPAGGPDAGVATPADGGTTPPAGNGLESLDPMYLCGEAAATDHSLPIAHLENGVPYNIILLAIDTHGNASGVEFIESVTPQPVTDFWEDLHDQHSQVESGFCLFSDTYGDGGPITRAMRGFRDDTLGATAWGRALTRFYYAHVAWLGELARAHWPVRVLFAILLLPVVAFALAWHVFTLPGLFALAAAMWWLARRRRRGARRLLVAAPAVIMMLVALGGRARAQPDSDFADEAIGDDEGDIAPPEPDWIVGVKLGPYVPGIDAQFQAQTGATTRPYHQMFGGYNIVPMLDVDRVVYRGAGGQVTAGISLGILIKSANPFTASSMPSDPIRDRSPGDNNAFRMFPFAVEAGYRFTYLDDVWGVPIVPYVRGGLAYYPWWIKAPNGNLAFVGDGNCHPDAATCTKETAAGASAGLQGSIGIEIRAERLDADAAASARDSGIAHAGFYGEIQSAWVDGFGNPKRFSLGTTTWFAGVSFEF